MDEIRNIDILRKRWERICEKRNECIIIFIPRSSCFGLVASLFDEFWESIDEIFVEIWNYLMTRGRSFSDFQKWVGNRFKNESRRYKKTFVTFSHKSKLGLWKNMKNLYPKGISMLRKGQINSGWQKKSYIRSSICCVAMGMNLLSWDTIIYEIFHFDVWIYSMSFIKRWASRLAPGSSRITTFGLWTSARTKLTRSRWPTERDIIGWVASISISQ